MYKRQVLELVDRGYLMINQSNRMADLLFIRCLGDLPAVAGQAVRLKDPTLGTVSGYTVYRLRHWSDASGRMTDVYKRQPFLGKGNARIEGCASHIFPSSFPFFTEDAHPYV